MSSDGQSPPCRVCGRSQWVGVWSPDKPEDTICVECCPQAEHANGETGHEFSRGSVRETPSCIHCGEER